MVLNERILLGAARWRPASGDSGSTETPDIPVQSLLALVFRLLLQAPCSLCALQILTAMFCLALNFTRNSVLGLMSIQ